MIKCFGSGKSLKQFFIILLISCFILLGSSSVNACTPRTEVNEGVYINGGIHPVGGLFTSSNNNAFDNGVFTLGNFRSSNLGVEKKLFAYDDNNFWFWDSDGLPYFYGNDIVNETIFQGNPNGYYYCEEIDGNTSTSLTNCSYNNIGTGSSNLFKTFMSSVKFGDYFAYLEERYFRESTYSSLCISNSFVGHTVCFVIDSSYGCNGINSKGYSNLTYNSIPDSILFDSPAVVNNNSGGLSSGGSSDGYIDNNLTGDYIYTTCTNGFALNKLESYGMNKYMCYGGLTGYANLDLTTNYNIVAGEGETVFNIYNQTRKSGQSFEDWFTYWNTTYTHQYVANQNLFLNNPAVLRSYFYLYNQYGDGFTNVDIKEYCRLLLTTNTGDTYNGKMQYLCRGYNEDGSSQNESGYNVESVNWNGVGNIGSGSSSGNSVKVSNDPVVFIQNFFNELKASLPTRYDLGGGFLPVYIITFLCAIILFRFLSH